VKKHPWQRLQPHQDAVIRQAEHCLPNVPLG
jgi:hypothetical protein